MVTLLLCALLTAVWATARKHRNLKQEVQLQEQLLGLLQQKLRVYLMGLWVLHLMQQLGLQLMMQLLEKDVLPDLNLQTHSKNVSMTAHIRIAYE